MQTRDEKTSIPENYSVKAVIPAAGLGKRFHPLSLAVPKELLPVNRKPLIHWAVEEALTAGVRDIGIVICKGKEMIRDYFEALMRSSTPSDECFQHELHEGRLHFIRQEKPLGLGNAIYESGGFLNDSPFIMIIPDQLILSKVPGTTQLLHAASGDVQAIWSSVVAISGEELHLFPGARRFKLTTMRKNIWVVKGIRSDSESSPEQSLIGFGRTFFPAGIHEFFSDRFLNPVTGEVDLLPSFEALIGEYRNYAALLEGTPLDFGTWEGYEHFSRGLTGYPVERRYHAEKDERSNPKDN
jgi:UTP--glucose-1-phosphate uridylyltransferase